MRDTLLKSGVMFICTFILFSSNPASAKFINAFLMKHGDKILTNNVATAQYLAQYDLIITRQMESDDIGGSYGSTWKAIKQYNPNCKIFLYTKVNCTDPNQDSASIFYTNNLARYSVSRGHSDGRLKDHDDYFLHRSGQRWIHGTDGYLLDPGDANFQAYSLEATLNDFKGQPWSADGVYTDVLMSNINIFGWSDEYTNQSAWSNAVKSLINHLARGLHSQGQAFSVNHGNSGDADIKDHWIALNSIANPPDYLLEEGGLAVLYGGGDIQFYGEGKWKNQITTMAKLTNTGYLAAASTNLSNIDDTGTDNYGKTFTGWDALYFAMGSFCLGKDNEDAFFFRTAGSIKPYSRWDYYYDEYDILDLGSALGGFQVANYGGNNIYWREFKKGYVYVNPTRYNVTSIPLPVPCKRRTHENLYINIDNLPKITTINLNAHRAAFLYKSDPSAKTVIPPSDLYIID